MISICTMFSGHRLNASLLKQRDICSTLRWPRALLSRLIGSALSIDISMSSSGRVHVWNTPVHFNYGVLHLYGSFRLSSVLVSNLSFWTSLSGGTDSFDKWSELWLTLSLSIVSRLDAETTQKEEGRVSLNKILSFGTCKTSTPN